MDYSARELIDILEHEREIYEKIFHMEEEKSDAIIERDGKVIEELSLSQEKFLKEIEILENKRVTLMKKCKSASKIKGEITLQDIIESIDSAQSRILKQAGVELKNVLLKVARVQDLNSQLLTDNMEFYDIIISGLKNSSTIRSGYGSDGKEQAGTVNPVLFNIKA
ncbi:MAG: flagellar protein FlgN [Spirochaetes bacterium]|nr:flagellar protein FlgN [Spirochaetota bacterium]